MSTATCTVSTGIPSTSRERIISSATAAGPAADGATQVVPVACGWYGPPVVHVIQNDTSDATNENGNLEITLR